MSRHRCPYCRCGKTPSRDDLVAQIAAGVKAEGDNWFCQPRCGSCATEYGGRCPRDPYCKRYLTELRP